MILLQPIYIAITLIPLTLFRWEEKETGKTTLCDVLLVEALMLRRTTTSPTFHKLNTQRDYNAGELLRTSCASA